MSDVHNLSSLADFIEQVDKDFASSYEYFKGPFTIPDEVPLSAEKVRLENVGLCYRTPIWSHGSLSGHFYCWPAGPSRILVVKVLERDRFAGETPLGVLHG